VAAAGDVNGDGYQDVAIGADGCDGGEPIPAASRSSTVRRPASRRGVAPPERAAGRGAFGRFVAGAEM